MSRLCRYGVASVGGFDGLGLAPLVETTRIDIVYRPLRIGWAVKAGDLAGLRQAVRLSHALWGGRFNPILVVDREAEARQLIELFRVDMIWPATAGDEAKKFEGKFPHLITPFMGEGLIGPDASTNVLDVQNAMTYLHDKPQWKGARERGIRLFRWQPDDPLADVLRMQLGEYPDPAECKVDYRAMLAAASEAKEEEIEKSAPLPDSAVENVSIAYMSRLGVDAYRDDRDSFHPGFYVGEADNFDDLVTFWNIRAADIPVWFIDRRTMDRYSVLLPACIKRATEALAQGRRAWARQVGVWSRGSVEADAKLLGEHPFVQILVSDLTWNGLNLKVPVMSLGETSVLGVVGEGSGRPRVSFAYGSKPFSGDVWFHQQRLVASISCRGGLAHNAKFLFCPPYVPELNEFYAREMAWDYDRLRIEPEGLGLVIGAHDHDGFLHALPFDDLMVRLFKLAGYEAKLSSGGLIARQLIDRLEGLQGGRVFKIPGVRRLIKTYGLTDTFTRETALQLIAQADPENPGAKFSDHIDLHIEQRPRGTKLTPSSVFGYLVENGLFRIGADVKCPRCHMTTWLPLDTLKEQIVCELCGHEHNATRQLAEAEWRFRRSGVLGAERNAQGAIPVALTLQQLHTTVHGPLGTTAYSPSLDIAPLEGKPGKICEIDLVWLTAKARWAADRTVIVLGECKDQLAIDATTMESLREVADAFPSDRFEVYILLAKVAPFTPEEIEQAKKMKAGGRSRVIMLTARELEPYFIFERTKNEFAFTERGHDAEGLAQVTAQIYFSDVPPKKG